MTEPAPGFGAAPDGGADAVVLKRMTDTLTILQCKRPTENRAAMIAALKAIRDKAADDVKVMIVVEGQAEELFVRQFLATLNRTSIGAAEVYVARANASARRVADILGRAIGPDGKSTRRFGTVPPLATPAGLALDLGQEAELEGAMDLARLRELVRGAAGCLVDLCTHEELGSACASLGLPEPPRQAEPGSGESLTKPAGASPGWRTKPFRWSPSGCWPGGCLARWTPRPGTRSRTSCGLPRVPLRFPGRPAAISPGPLTSATSRSKLTSSWPS
jgi:hypothetical protein